MSARRSEEAPRPSDLYLALDILATHFATLAPVQAAEALAAIRTRAAHSDHRAYGIAVEELGQAVAHCQAHPHVRPFPAFTPPHPWGLPELSRTDTEADGLPSAA